MRRVIFDMTKEQDHFSLALWSFGYVTIVSEGLCVPK